LDVADVLIAKAHHVYMTSVVVVYHASKCCVLQSVVDHPVGHHDDSPVGLIDTSHDSVVILDPPHGIDTNV
jgi:hypothetical protein